MNRLATGADTRSMPIVHDALRRDLGRTQSALTISPHLAVPRRLAIADHLRWMMTFLHEHHTAEDAGLWPVVRRNNPSSSALLDDMARDHERIGPGIESVVRAADGYGHSDSDDARCEVLRAIDTLSAVLLPHLEREEAETMPVVGDSITQADWERWDKDYNIKPNSLSQLGRIGHWIMDDLDPGRQRIIKELVPPVPRFVLVHGFRHSYERYAAACWGGSRSTPA